MFLRKFWEAQMHVYEHTAGWVRHPKGFCRFRLSGMDGLIGQRYPLVDRSFGIGRLSCEYRRPRLSRTVMLIAFMLLLAPLLGVTISLSLKVGSPSTCPIKCEYPEPSKQKPFRLACSYPRPIREQIPIRSHSVVLSPEPELEQHPGLCDRSRSTRASAGRDRFPRTFAHDPATVSDRW
jgi:hypothetical protein